MLDLINSVYPTADKNGNFSLTQDLKDRTDPRYTSQRENMRYDGMFGGGDFSDPTYAGMLSRAGLKDYEKWAVRNQRIVGSGDNYGEVYKPTMADYAQAKGYDIRRKFLPNNKVEDRVYINGKPTDQVIRFTVNDRAGALAALAAAAIVTGGVAAAGTGGAGAGGAATAAGSGGGYSLGGTLAADALPAAGGFTTAESLGAGALNGLVISPEAAAAAGGAAGAAGAASGGGYSAGGTLGASELPAAGGYTTSSNLGSNALNGMNVGGAAGSATGMSEAAYGWNPEGYTGGTPSMAGGGFGGGGMGGLSDYGGWINLGAGLINGYLGADAARRAGNQIGDASREANALQKYMYDTTRQDNMPALQARNNGLAGYQNLLKNPSSLANDPTLQFQLKEAQKQISNQMAAKGGYYSGAQLKASSDRAQQVSNQYMDSVLNRYGALAGMGQVGTSQIGQAGMNYGNQAGANLINAGNARGAATIAGQNAWTNALNGLVSYGNNNIWGN